MIAFSTIILYKPIGLSISVYVYSSLFSLGYYINNRPMDSKIVQVLDNTNELFILISGYAIILFSNWIYNIKYNRDEDNDISDLPQLRYNYGFIYIAFLGFAVTTNLILIIFGMGKGIQKSFRKRKYYKKWGDHYKQKIL